MKVGDYVRFADGRIGKVAKYEYREEYVNGHFIYLDNDEHCGLCCEEKDFKASPNIIDLIEVGDYVNGDKVVNFMLNNNLRAGVIVDSSHYGYDFDEIKSIVTRQEFKRREHKL